MGIKPNSLQIGKLFFDDALISVPEEYRLHKVTRITEDTLISVHISSKSERIFNLTNGLDNLRYVPSEPEINANLDCIVDSYVQLTLNNSCRIHGKVTAVKYGRIELSVGENNYSLKMVKAVELDGSGMTTYSWDEISSVTVIGG